MSFRLIAFVICALPYVYMVYFWGFCSDCTPTGHSWFYSLVLFLALPFLIAGFAVSAAISGAQALRDNLVEKKPVRAVASGGFAWLAIIIAIPTVYVSWDLYRLFFPEVEEGRDRIGRICETDGSVTTCRPDPAKKRDTLDMLNEKRQPS